MSNEITDVGLSIFWYAYLYVYRYVDVLTSMWRLPQYFCLYTWVKVYFRTGRYPKRRFAQRVSSNRRNIDIPPIYKRPATGSSKIRHIWLSRNWRLATWLWRTLSRWDCRSRRRRSREHLCELPPGTWSRTEEMAKCVMRRAHWLSSTHTVIPSHWEKSARYSRL